MTSARTIIEDESARDFLLRQIKLGKMGSSWMPFVDEHNLSGFITFKHRLRDSDAIAAVWLQLAYPNHNNGIWNTYAGRRWVAYVGLYRDLADFAKRSPVRNRSYDYSSLTRPEAEAAAKRDALCFAHEHAAALRGSR